MPNYFEGLSEIEYAALIDAIPLITALIAGADGKIDDKEIEWAKKIAKIRSFNGPEILQEFYDDAGMNFESRLKELIDELPDNTDERCASISGRLSLLNPILAGLDQTLGAILYTSYLSLAEHVAKASGGFLRMWSVSKEEARWMKLPMLTPIELPDALEEEE